MIEIMTAESVARETIKNVLEIEIPKVNETILAAKKRGQRNCYLKIRISGATEKLLKKAGYIAQSDSDGTEISWEGVYNKLMNNDEFIEEVSRELNVRIVDLDNSENTIDPNWKPPRDED